MATGRRTLYPPAAVDGWSAGPRRACSTSAAGNGALARLLADRGHEVFCIDRDVRGGGRAPGPARDPAARRGPGRVAALSVLPLRRGDVVGEPAPVRARSGPVRDRPGAEARRACWRWPTTCGTTPSPGCAGWPRSCSRSTPPPWPVSSASTPSQRSSRQPVLQHRRAPGLPQLGADQPRRPVRHGGPSAREPPRWTRAPGTSCCTTSGRSTTARPARPSRCCCPTGPPAGALSLIIPPWRCRTTTTDGVQISLVSARLWLRRPQPVNLTAQELAGPPWSGTIGGGRR